MRTATWRLTGESVSQLVAKVGLLVPFWNAPHVCDLRSGLRSAEKTHHRPKNTDDAKTRKQGLIMAGEIAKAMELDDQVDRVISCLKRKRDLREDQASSTNGLAMVQKP